MAGPVRTPAELLAIERAARNARRAMAPGARPMGRRTAFDARRLPAAITVAERDGTVDELAAALRVSRQTYFNWQARGEAGEEPYAALVQQIAAARTRAKDRSKPGRGEAKGQASATLHARVVAAARLVNEELARLRADPAPPGWMGPHPSEWLGPDVAIDETLPLREQALACARQHLLPFAVQTYNGRKPYFRVSWHHVLVSVVLEAYARGRLRRLAISLPPRHGKSELASRALPAYVLGLDANNSMVSGAHTAILAKKNSKDVKNILRLARYQEVFPCTRPPTRKQVMSGERESTGCRWDLEEGSGRYVGGGMDGAVAGEGGGLVGIDDPVKSREEADSQAYQDDCLARLTDDWWSRAEPPGCLLMMGTRWSKRDVIGQQLDDSAAELRALQVRAVAEGRPLDPEEISEHCWFVVNLPAILEVEEDRTWGDRRAVGEPLWLEFQLRPPIEWREGCRPDDEELTRRCSAEFVAKLRKPGGRAMLQGKPTVRGGERIKLAWLARRYSTLPFGIDTAEWIQSWDLKAFSASQDARSSYVVGQVWLRLRGSQDCYLVDEVRGRWGVLETLTAMRRLSARWPLAVHRIVEAKAAASSLAALARQPWKDQAGVQHAGLAVEMVEPKGDKIGRLEAVLPSLEEAPPLVILPTDESYAWMPEWVQEVVGFRGLSNKEINDRVDALTQALAYYMARPAVGIYHQTTSAARWSSPAASPAQWHETAVASIAADEVRTKGGRWGAV